ncbi:hypothetical protein [Microcystis phage Mwe-JY05]
MNDPVAVVAVLILVVAGVCWSVRAEYRHRRDRVTELLGKVRALAGRDLDAAHSLHQRAAATARWLPRDALADTDQWLLDVGPIAAVPHPPGPEPVRHRFGVVARPRPDGGPLSVDPLDHIGTARIRPVVPLDPPPRHVRGGTGERGRAARR